MQSADMLRPALGMQHADQPRFPSGEELNMRSLQEEQDRLSNVSEMISSMVYRDEEATKLWRIVNDLQPSSGNGLDLQRDTYRGLKTAEHLWGQGGKHGHILQKGKKRHLPERLLTTIQSLQADRLMMGGVLPEIHRAWISIDHVLYLWNYNDSTYEVHDFLDEVIISVALVKPRPGVFLDRTDWLLVVTTPTDVSVLAVLFENPVDYDAHAPIPAKSKLVLQPTAVNVSTDNVMMMCVIGTPEGRIFMGGRDGCLYELVYAVESNWSGTSRKCRKVNHSGSGGVYRQGRHMMVETMKFLGANGLASRVFGAQDGRVTDMCYDASRQLLYVLIENTTDGSSIEGFDLRPDGQGLHCFCSMSHDYLKRELVRSRSMLAGTEEQLRTLVKLCPGPPLKPGEIDHGPHLIVMSNTGLRVYLRVYRNEDNTLGDGMQVMHHAPFPSNELLSRQLHNTSKIQSFEVDEEPCRSFLTPGLCLVQSKEGALTNMSNQNNARQQSSTVMVALSRSCTTVKVANNTYVQSPPLRGAAEDVEVVLPGNTDYDHEGRPLRVLSVAESQYPYGCSLFGSAAGMQLNELASQHDHWPREILVLMEDGLQSYLKLRPIDWLALYLQHDDPGYQPVLEELFEEFGKDEACSMCYSLACTDFGSLPRESLLRVCNIEAVRRNATSLLNRGLTIGEALAGAPLPLGAPAMDQNGIAATASPVASGSAVPQWTRSYSHRFNGLQLYAARLLSGVWEKRVVTARQDLSFKHPEHWKIIVTGLDKLIELLQKLYPGKLVAPLRASQQAGYTQMIDFYQEQMRHQQELDREAQHAEARVVFAMYKLLQLAREAAQLFYHLSLVDSAELPHPGMPRSRFVNLVGALSAAEQKELEELTFRQLVTKSECRQMVQNREPVFRKLVQQMVLNPSHRQLADDLKEDCPSFFGPEDHKRLQANKMLMEASNYSHSDPKRTEQVKQAVALYREIGKYIDRELILDPLQGLLFYGFYADAVELILLKAQHITDTKQREEVLSDAVDVMQKIWHHRQTPDARHECVPRMEREELDYQWSTALEKALDLGQPRLLRDNGSFHCTVFDLLFQLTPSRAARDQLVALPTSHLNLIKGTLFQYLEREHKEYLFRGYRAAGYLRESAQELYNLAIESVSSRVQRRAVPVEDLVEQRILWLTQGILDLRGMGMGTASHHADAGLSQLLGLLQEHSEVLEVQKHVRNALLHCPSIPPPEYLKELQEGVCNTTTLWSAVAYPVDLNPDGSAGCELWMHQKLFREALLILKALSHMEGRDEMFIDKVNQIWQELVDCKTENNRPLNLQDSGQAALWRNRIESGEGSLQHINLVLELDPRSAVFPLGHVLLMMESKYVEVVETLKLPFAQGGWIANLVLKHTRANFEDVYLAYMNLLKDPRFESQPLQVHLLQSTGLLLRDWLAASDPADQTMFRNAVIDFDEFYDIISRNHTVLTSDKREVLRNLFVNIKDTRAHLNWYS
eukprot:TRINITY_DN10762_c0_g1_i2.p1 TRINITY_DN10762_c0_g1~~TRINITY_DN10762_c0_g1_i2.p1  ORF type:complete len:1481 (+),score=454.69 TRINITY_DN10762_c0_g1_i2:208-4650(+)